ncbi:MAG: hypothetical protein ACJ762_07330 [Solirubrobacteraceae bacterium]
MYEFSRQIYRQLAGELEPPVGVSRSQAARRLLAAAEYAFGRLAEDPWLADRLRRTLFSEVRPLFAMARHPHVLEVIATTMEAGRRRAELLPPGPIDVDGNPLRCSALVRSGAPCERPPGDDGLCPSHRHYVDAFREAPSAQPAAS